MYGLEPLDPSLGNLVIPRRGYAGQRSVQRRATTILLTKALEGEADDHLFEQRQLIVACDRKQLDRMHILSCGQLNVAIGIRYRAVKLANRIRGSVAKSAQRRKRRRRCHPHDRYGSIEPRRADNHDKTTLPAVREPNGIRSDFDVLVFAKFVALAKPI